MAKAMSHTACFAHFGAKPRNIKWSWSARSADGKNVIVTLWQDHFKRRDGKLCYVREGGDPLNPDRRPGYRELMENLTWAIDNCDRQFNVIVAIAKDTTAHPRSIAECHP